MNNELSADYIKAQELDRRIKISAQLAQQSLYDMCMGFKEMRDSKLYKELGYSDFGDYCEQETGFKRRTVYKYISVAENLPSDFVPPGAQIGIKKLYLLSTLSDEDRTELAENTDLGSTSVRELEQQIKELKIKADKADILSHRLDDMNRNCDFISGQRDEAKRKIAELEAEIKDLESRPVEVAVTDNSAEENRLRETIKSLERENIRRNEELEEQYRKDEQTVRRMLEQEKQSALDKLSAEKEEKLSVLKAELETMKSEYEKKLAEKPQTSPVDEKKVKFKILLSAAYDSLMRAAEFAKSSGEQDFKEKIRQLSTAAEKILEV